MEQEIDGELGLGEAAVAAAAMCAVGGDGESVTAMQRTLRQAESIREPTAASLVGAGFAGLASTDAHTDGGAGSIVASIKPKMNMWKVTASKIAAKLGNKVRCAF
jgi:hypothetical protein